MGALFSIGSETKTIIFAREADKISLEFTVATSNTIRIGQPVKLNSTGEVLPWTKADKKRALVGYALQNALANQTVTIITVGFMVIGALAGAGGTTIGPVTYQSYDTTTDKGKVEGLDVKTGYSVYDNLNVDGSENDAASGFALQSGAAGDFIQVLVY